MVCVAHGAAVVRLGFGLGLGCVAYRAAVVRLGFGLGLGCVAYGAAIVVAVGPRVALVVAMEAVGAVEVTWVKGRFRGRVGGLG